MFYVHQLEPNSDNVNKFSFAFSVEILSMSLKILFSQRNNILVRFRPSPYAHYRHFSSKTVICIPCGINRKVLRIRLSGI